MDERVPFIHKLEVLLVSVISLEHEVWKTFVDPLAFCNKQVCRYRSTRSELWDPRIGREPVA